MDGNNPQLGDSNMTYLNLCADMKNFSSPAANKCKNLHSLNFRMRFWSVKDN